MSYIILVALLLGNASSREYIDDPEAVFEVIGEGECSYTISNVDSVVLDNVPALSGLLGYRVDYYTLSGFFGYVKTGESTVLLGSALGYNAFQNTVTFSGGQLDIVMDNCGDE